MGLSEHPCTKIIAIASFVAKISKLKFLAIDTSACALLQACQCVHINVCTVWVCVCVCVCACETHVEVMVRNLSCPAVSHICSFTFSPFTSIVLILKSTPMVVMYVPNKNVEKWRYKKVHGAMHGARLL